ncbi:MAG TPA: DUF4124 domain-containing protein [Usitatibacteraceae bacterium]|nr:DUF4124 domain-containing protein [Usitatibacteraceae bacterium]
MKRNRLSAVGLWLLLGASLLSQAADAQGLWKYTDKDGKVTYSDKPPKPGEKAEQVKNDPNANVIESVKGKSTAAPASPKTSPPKAAPVDRRAQLDAAIAAVAAARAELEAARKALEDGREPLPEEVTVTVGRTKTGATSGSNSVIRKPEYYERVALLEETVRVAEVKLEEAETALSKARK